ncbi:MAG: outer membrane beta-barrel protein [Terracidiphilus sp.]
MKPSSWKAVPAVALLCCAFAPSAALAQQKAKDTTPVQFALLEPPAAEDPGAGSGKPATATETPATSATPAGTAATGAAAAAASSSAATASTSTTAPAASVAVPVSRDAVIKELTDMKARIAQLEAELKARSGADDAADAEKDANALRGAEGETTGSMGVGQTAVTGQAAPAPAPAAAPPAPEITAETTTKSAPFNYFDQTWLNSGGHNVDSPMSTKYFTPEIRFDANYILDYNHPEDDSMVGSTEMYRSDEFQLEQASVGGDFRIQNTRGRILYMDGLFSQATVRNDASYNRGQWDLKDAYKYFSEAWGGYHWDVNHGLNVDAGIFVSYIGMFSYYNFDNWSYQPSFVSSNTPWFFNGLRIQWWPTAKLKIEPWIINGWQSYARYNGHGGLGGQIIWRPTPKLHFNFNNYGMGEDDAGYPGRSRVHADYTSQYKIYDQPKQFLDKIAWTMTGDLGCEYGGGPISFATANGTLNQKGLSPMMGTTDTYNGGVRCHGSNDGRPKQMFAGWMSYVRFWFDHDRHAITLGGGQMNNPGRYLTLVPSINGSTATSGTPYYTENAGDRAQMHDGTITYDYMPSQFIVFRLEEAYRYSDTPYWSGRGGVTPPGGNNGNPADYQCAAGGDAGAGYVWINPAGVAVSGQAQAIANCIGLGLNNGGSGTSALWWPDLRTNQTTTLGSIMVRF